MGPRSRPNIFEIGSESDAGQAAVDDRGASDRDTNEAGATQPSARWGGRRTKTFGRVAVLVSTLGAVAAFAETVNRTNDQDRRPSSHRTAAPMKPAPTLQIARPAERPPASRARARRLTAPRRVRQPVALSVAPRVAAGPVPATDLSPPPASRTLPVTTPSAPATPTALAPVPAPARAAQDFDFGP